MWTGRHSKNELSSGTREGTASKALPFEGLDTFIEYFVSLSGLRGWRKLGVGDRLWHEGWNPASSTKEGASELGVLRMSENDASERVGHILQIISLSMWPRKVLELYKPLREQGV